MTIRMDAMISKPLRAAVIAAGLSVGLTACGGDGLELNGRLFDMMGVSDAAQKAAAREPKMTERTGIVMPPDASRLPEPGSGNGEPDIAAQLNDPDRKRQMAAAERERLHKAYCSGEQTWKERARSKPGNDGAPTSPYGPCSLVGNILKQ
jgi:hypothetical protein